MPARVLAHPRRAAATAAAVAALAMTGALITVSPAQASVVTIDRAPTAASVMVAPRQAPAPVVTAASRVLAMAASLRGRPYQYGASGPSAFDCSGFTRYVFAHALGRSLVHNAEAQYAASLKLSRSAVRPGDLVFYTSAGYAYHVGIYAGGGLIWDAPHTGETVRLEAIATSSWVAGRVR